MYSHLSNSRGGENRQGGGTKVVKSINVEEGINEEVGIFWKGDIGKQAHGHIWVRFFIFRQVFFQNFRIGFFWPGGLNSAVRSDLAPLHSWLYFTN